MYKAPEAYEAKALEFLSARERSTIGLKEVTEWSKTLPDCASVIDLACGGGYPITSVFNSAGFKLWAVDSSPTLVKVFSSRFPQVPIQCEKVQDFDFFNRTFDAAIAIGLVFLLSEPDQISLISNVSRKLNQGGRFLFTAPTQTGSWEDICTGALSLSLGQSRYEELLNKAGFRIVSNFTDSGNNNYFDVELATECHAIS